jgi:hypothetical protein
MVVCQNITICTDDKTAALPFAYLLSWLLGLLLSLPELRPEKSFEKFVVLKILKRIPIFLRLVHRLFRTDEHYSRTNPCRHIRKNLAGVAQSFQIGFFIRFGET